MDSHHGASWGDKGCHNPVLREMGVLFHLVLALLYNLTIPLGDHFRHCCGGCGCISPSAGEGSRVKLVLQPLETAGSAGVDSALPISDPLAQIALGNAALSLLLRLNTVFSS